MDSDEPVVGNSEVVKLEDRVRELKRVLGCKTMEVEILREALPKWTQKNGYRGRSCCRRTVSDEDHRRHVGHPRSNLVERLKGRSKPRGSYYKAEDAELLPTIRRLVDQRPTYGYRRIAALLNSERRAADQPVVNAKRVHRIMGNHGVLLEMHTAVRKGRIHDGNVMVMRPNLL